MRPHLFIIAKHSLALHHILLAFGASSKLNQRTHRLWPGIHRVKLLAGPVCSMQEIEILNCGDYFVTRNSPSAAMNTDRFNENLEGQLAILFLGVSPSSLLRLRLRRELSGLPLRTGPEPARSGIMVSRGSSSPLMPLVSCLRPGTGLPRQGALDFESVKQGTNTAPLANPNSEGPHPQLNVGPFAMFEVVRSANFGAVVLVTQTRLV